MENMNTVRIILSSTTYFGQELQQFDAKKAFLHGHLEEVYMEIALGFRYFEEGNKV